MINCNCCGAKLSRIDDEHICDERYYKNLREFADLKAKCEAYEAMIADEEFCEVNLWSYHPLCHDTLVSISESDGKWQWYDALNEGKLVPRSPEFDSLLEAYAAIKDAETSQEKAD